MLDRMPIGEVADHASAPMGVTGAPALHKSGWPLVFTLYAPAPEGQVRFGGAGVLDRMPFGEVADHVSAPMGVTGAPGLHKSGWPLVHIVVEE